MVVDIPINCCVRLLHLVPIRLEEMMTYLGMHSNTGRRWSHTNDTTEQQHI